MIYILEVLIERGVFELNKPFYYFVDSIKKLESGIRVRVNFKNSNCVGYVLNVREPNKKDCELIELKKLKPILSIIDDKRIIDDELLKVANYMSYRYVTPLISCLQTMLPSSLKPTASSKNAAKIKYNTYYSFISGSTNITKRQQEVLELIKNEGPVLKSKVSSTIAKKLLELKLIKEEKNESYRRVEMGDFNFLDFELTEMQKNILDKCITSKKSTILLKGVTGSGKTEIYIKLIEEYIKQNKSAIILLPEINLTPFICAKFNYFFKNNVAILTSGLSNAQRFDEYRRIVNENIKIVVGTRSAIFAPVKNLGIIIIDEEFSDSYKQDDKTPFYNAIEIAQYRVNLNNAKLLLASATPSISSMARAKKGLYDYIELNERYNNSNLPFAKLIDMRNLNNLYPGCSALSKELVFAIENAINNDEQVILLLNKRGYSNFLVCDECSTSLLCPNCNHPLIFFKSQSIFKCSICGKTYHSKDLKCRVCENDSFVSINYGTEKLEQDIKLVFPNASVLRMDSDSIYNSKKSYNAIKDFKNKKYNILLGTQMVAKGHDFPNVTVVGIISIDQLLSLPFYDINEKVYQLITQCIGRVGRGLKKGIAFVQSNTMDSYAINTGVLQDYDIFYNEEIKYRKKLFNPPFYYVVKLSIKNNDMELVKNTAKDIYVFLTSTISNDAKPIIYIDNRTYKLKDRFIKNVIIKHKNYDLVLPILNEFIKTYRFSKNTEIIINVDTSRF